MQTRIILIRHGETDWNKERRYLSHTDIDINDTGRAQALAAAKSIKDENIARVYASDRKRAVNSAQLLFKGCPIEQSPDLREMNFGIFEGQRYEEILAAYKNIYDSWINDPHKASIPQGETFAAFESRVMGKIRVIAQDNIGKTTAVVTHGGVIRLILYAILKPKRFWDIKMVAPGTVTIIEADADGVLTVKRYEPEGDIWPKK